MPGLRLVGSAAYLMALVVDLRVARAATSLTIEQQLARDVYRELVEIDTVTASDMMAAAWIANLVRYKREGYIPERDITWRSAGESLRVDLDDIRALGKDERLSVASFYEGTEYLYRLVKMLAGPEGVTRTRTR